MFHESWIRLRGSQGKMTFFILSNFYNDDGPTTVFPSVNSIIEFIRRKAEKRSSSKGSNDDKKRKVQLYGNRGGNRSITRSSGGSSKEQSALG